MDARERNRKVHTTLRLPKPLYEQARALVENGFTTAETMNDFFIAATRSYTKMLQRKQIDAGFALMAKDANYQKEARVITEDFAQSDWETLEPGIPTKEENHAAR